VHLHYKKIIMDNDTITLIANELFNSEKTRVPILPITDTYPDLTLEEAYKIQLASIDIRKLSGQRVIGKKVGLTNTAVQKVRGILEPDYGHIMDTHIGRQDIPLKMSELMISPAIEAEIAFILKKELKGPGMTCAAVLDAIGGIMPAFEIVERRCFPLSKTIQDSICDNAACGKVIFGNKLTTKFDIDFRTIGLLIEKNGVPIDMSCSASVLGSPVESIVWLVNKLATFGEKLHENEVIITGSIGLMHEVKAGDIFYAHFGEGLGSVKVCFTK